VSAGFLVLNRSELDESELQGINAGVGVCLIFIDLPPGEGPKLHRHPYEEIFIILEGTPRFRVGDETLEAAPGQIVIVRPSVPHAFVNAGAGRLRQLDIHVSPSFQTEWLE
jgi:mannose-6-phosphate isomerase-like protein (cupin superfamily)